MKAEKASPNTDVPLDDHELLILHQALNEVLNGLDVPEFSTRIGAEREEVATLMRKMKEAVSEAQEP